MSNLTNEVCAVIENILTDGSKELSTSITYESTMNNPVEWDSLNFVKVFLGLSEHFKLEVDDEDAINFTSVENIVNFIEENTEN